MLGLDTLNFKLELELNQVQKSKIGGLSTVLEGEYCTFLYELR